MQYQSPREDPQRDRFTAAQHQVPKGHLFPNLAAVQRYVDSVTASAWWRDQVRGIPHIVCQSSRTRRSTADSYTHRNVLRFTATGRNQRTVIHELAHQVTDFRCGVYLNGSNGPRREAHGAEYAYWFAVMVRQFLGAEAAQILSEAYLLHEIRSDYNAHHADVQFQKTIVKREVGKFGIVGEVGRTTNRRTGAIIATLDGTRTESPYPTALPGLRWVTWCITHGNFLHTATRQESKYACATPTWCRNCNAYLW
jgi:putative metallohydrolase (TIGR04338 family)